MVDQSITRGNLLADGVSGVSNAWWIETRALADPHAKAARMSLVQSLLWRSKPSALHGGLAILPSATTSSTLFLHPLAAEVKTDLCLTEG